MLPIGSIPIGSIFSPLKVATTRIDNNLKGYKFEEKKCQSLKIAKF